MCLTREGVVHLAPKNHVYSCNHSPLLAQYSTGTTQGADFSPKVILCQLVCHLLWPTLCLLIPSWPFLLGVLPYTFYFFPSKSLSTLLIMSKHFLQSPCLTTTKLVSPDDEAFLIALSMVITCVPAACVLWPILLESYCDFQTIAFHNSPPSHPLSKPASDLPPYSCSKSPVDL